jgi:hypothetical protein
LALHEARCVRSVGRVAQISAALLPPRRERPI